MNLETLQQILDGQESVPVHLWQPEHVGTMDLVIQADGRWFYEGSPINRPALVRLFSTVLRREPDGSYCLVTPVEKLSIQVEDAPFVAVELDRLVDGDRSRLVFRTNVDEFVVAGPDHPIRIESVGDDASPRPYLMVRTGLDALISRNVFYAMVELAEQRVGSDGSDELYIRSDGESFVLGTV